MRIAGELHAGVMQEMPAVAMLPGTARHRVSTDTNAARRSPCSGWFRKRSATRRSMRTPHESAFG